jgi:hypothetical protein
MRNKPQQTQMMVSTSSTPQRLRERLKECANMDSGIRVRMATRASVKNEKQYEALKDKGMSKERAAKIANSPQSSEHGGKKSGSGGNSKQGGTTAQKKEAGRKGGKAAAKKS